jgi:hypothetical protein
MKTPEEIKKGLEYLRTTDVAEKVERFKMGLPYAFTEEVAADALVLIQKLEDENAAMLETIKRMAHSGGVCIGCAHMDDEPTILEHCEDLDFDCEKCQTPCACHSCKEGSNYTWRGAVSDDEKS